MKRIEVVFDIPVDKTFDYLPGEFGDRIYPGARVRVPFGSQQKTGIALSVREEGVLKEESCKSVLRVYDSAPLVTGNLFSVASFLSDRYFTSTGKALFSIVGALPTRYSAECVESGGKKDFQGSGFNEKYVIPAGEGDRFECNRKIIPVPPCGSAVFLFPEVAQAEKYYMQARALYGERALLFHGELKPKDRIAAWLRMLSGENIILAGTRLAVFSPLRDIAVFALNNGYDSSYREQQTPKYDTCEVARFRASSMNVPLFFIDASPSVNSYFPIDKEIEPDKDPAESEVEIKKSIYILPVNRKSVDKKISFLSRETVSFLEETVLKGEKAALVHNSKGSSKILRCEKCGGRFTCAACDSGLILSEDGKNLLCRFCNTVAPFEKKCPSCGSRKVSERLCGIEKMFSVLKQEYPSVGISKVVSRTEIDAAADFSILIGTRAIKRYMGVFPFGLVVFVSGESFLNVPDYRSEEHFFIMVNEIFASLLDKGCKIIIQTRNPNMEIYRSLKENNPGIFLSKETLVRKQLRYPPFAEIVKVELKSRKAAVLMERKTLLESYFEQKNIEVMYSGPSFPPVKKGKDVWKYLFRPGSSFDRKEFSRILFETGASVDSNPDRI